MTKSSKLMILINLGSEFCLTDFNDEMPIVSDTGTKLALILQLIEWVSDKLVANIELP